ncbi:MAG: hypothetical protein LBE27_06410 [Deltaproteobacteria bacterium]|jgi:hypothetical protein|nr:hypothetical protein [Deltaproteobacteria bacterium]
MKKTKPSKNPALPPLAQALENQERHASEKGINPFRRGLGNELISLRALKFPELTRLALQALPLDGNGWMSGDTLYLLAELSEDYGSSLLELQVRENQALLLGIKPSESERLRTAFLMEKGLKSKKVQTCSLWGPCLGERADYSSILEEIASGLLTTLSNDLKVGVALCPRDCRDLSEGVDLLVLADEDGSGFQLWLGGRARPFQKIVAPRPWKAFSGSEPHELLEFIMKVHDNFEALRHSGETLPEFALKKSHYELNLVFGLS